MISKWGHPVKILFHICLFVKFIGHPCYSRIKFVTWAVYNLKKKKTIQNLKDIDKTHLNLYYMGNTIKRHNLTFLLLHSYSTFSEFKMNYMGISSCFIPTAIKLLWWIGPWFQIHLGSWLGTWTSAFKPNILTTNLHISIRKYVEI